MEGLNPDIFGQFLHTIRNLYHSRDEHCLKSVILVGVSNIVGVVQDHASPFNIADNLEVPYFTDEETAELLHMHEEETGQLFDRKVKEKISYMTGNQPGLVNGFAYRLVEQYSSKPVIDYEDYLKTEHWYIKIAIDKNIANIVNKAKEHRKFVERLLFNENPVEFKIYRNPARFEKGKKKLACYCRILSIDKGIYLVFVPNTVTLPGIEEAEEAVNGIAVETYIVPYDEEKDF